MEDFEASDIVVQTRENEIPRLKHSCTPSTYKGVGEQVKFHEVLKTWFGQPGCKICINNKDLSIISAVNFSGWCGVPGLSDSASRKCLLLCSWPSSVQPMEVGNNSFVLAHYCPSYMCTIVHCSVDIPVLFRREELKTKGIDCDCERCSDGSEAGTGWFWPLLFTHNGQWWYQTFDCGHIWVNRIWWRQQIGINLASTGLAALLALVAAWSVLVHQVIFHFHLHFQFHFHFHLWDLVSPCPPVHLSVKKLFHAEEVHFWYHWLHLVKCICFLVPELQMDSIIIDKRLTGVPWKCPDCGSERCPESFEFEFNW